jgi:hypothetical protein
MRRGTAVTVALFLGLIAVKFGLGALAYGLEVDDGAGFGEVLVMVAVMVAVQAELVYRRSRSLLLTSKQADDRTSTGAHS